MAKHPHYEVIMEWAQDTSKVVQYRRHPSSEWEDERGTPDFNGFGEYRIKPTPKPDVVKHYHIGLERYFSVDHLSDLQGANLRVTLDGETGKLIKAEVLLK